METVYKTELKYNTINKVNETMVNVEEISPIETEIEIIKREKIHL